MIDYGSVSPGGSSIWVPYVGAGTYSVKILAYGSPADSDDADGRGEVIATGYSNTGRNHGGDQPSGADAAAGTVETQASSQDSTGDQANADPDGAAQTSPEAAAGDPAGTEATPAPDCTPAPPAPEPTPPSEPPADTDPANPDEDADGIPDAQEQATYQQQLAEYQAAVATQAASTTAPGC